MSGQNLFKTKYIEKLAYKVVNGDLSSYYEKKSDHTKDDLLVNENIQIDEKINLKTMEFFGDTGFENSRIFFEAYKSLTPEQASDPRLWTYLTHVTFRKYMQKKRLPKTKEKKQAAQFILQHWFVYPLNAKNLLRNDISLLWWGLYITRDPDESNPYELTKELFSMQDYTRHFQGSLGRNRIFVHAFLEFVIENKDIFSKFKEDKIRFLMRKSNQVGGYRNLSCLSKQEIKQILSNYKEDLEKIKGRNK